MEDTSVDKVLFQSDSRSKEAFVKMAEFRNKNQLTDITLVAGPKRITAHKVVIASLCDYFSAMFTNDLSETTQNEVTLNNVDPDALQALIDYAYSSELEIRVDNVESLLASACLLQIPDVKIACCDFMKNQLHPSNCLGIRAFADAHGCDLLFKIADDFTKDHFLEVSKNQEFLLLSADQLCDILASDDLNVSSEEYVFRSVDLWLRYDMEERNNFACQVIRCVRLPLLSPQFLVDEMESLPALRNSPNCKDILLETMKYHLLPERRKESKGLITRPRKGTVGVLYAIGGMDSIKGAAVCIEEFNPRINKWKEVAVMGTRRLQFGVAVLDGKLYITGGRDGLKTLNNVECFDPKTGTWSTLPPMLTHRHGVGVAVLSGPIYAVGGHDGWSYLNTVERFDPQAQQWSFVCSMNSPRSTVGVAVLEGKLYAVGGRDGSACLSSVEVYDPHTNKWTMAAPMLKRRGGVGVSILSGFLYAVGGHDAPASQDSSKQFCSVERYDPISDQWTLVAPMNYCRDAVGLASLGDRLFSVGGYDGTKYLDAVECYDPEKNEWETVAPLTHSRAGACVVSIKVS